MKILRLGDPHVKVSNLEESENLLHFVYETAIAQQVDRIEILGDLFDTHAIVRLEVMQFWNKWLTLFATSPYTAFETVVLVGNHDLSGSYHSSYSALSVFSVIENMRFKIVQEPILMGRFGYLPYIHDNAQFVAEANKLADAGATVLVSHTTYQGSAYDNGMFAPNGVDAGLVKESVAHLISGHIHAKQAFGRVIFPGTARWASVSDANKAKGFSIYTHDDLTGAIVGEEFVSTERVCLPIVQIELKESDTGLPVFPDKATVVLQLTGSSSWVAKMKDEYRGRCSISAKITDSKKAVTRKAGKSLMEFISSFYETKKRERLISFMQEMKLV